MIRAAMKTHLTIVLTLACLSWAEPALRAAGLFDFLGLSKGSTNTSAAAVASASGLSEQQITDGLKEALAKGVTQAVTNLGRPDGFLKDAKVRIPMPENLRQVEKTLRAVGQEKLADDFVNTMNRAAEQAVPEAAAVLGDSVKKMTVADAKSILASTNTAATAYFRRTSETNLYDRFLPIVRQATSKTGVTSTYKQMIEKLGFAGALINKDAGDLDGYVTRKTLDGLFVKIADEEASLRANPAARTTTLLKKVFGSATKQ